MNTHNSSPNNFGNNVYVTQVCDAYMPDTYRDNTNDAISDQRPKLNNNVTSPVQQPNVTSPNHNQQYQHPNFVSPNHNQQYQQPNVASLNHNQQYQQPSVASSDQYDANYQQYIQQPNYTNNVIAISPDRQPMPNINVTQQPSPNHNQQYQHYDPNSIHHHNDVQQPNNTDTTSSYNHDHDHQQPMSNNNATSDNNNHHDNHHNDQQSTSNNVSPPLLSPQSNIFPLSLNITINSPHTYFIIIPNSDIQQVLACLNNPSLANNSKTQ
ncbi:hypothetical protein GLOIN_2v1764957 [Rhizophagus clarus]|uniref:Uncharacterized protein n=2 Tax=Rhizophagus clarus TaxID=94130 RepID=A0A8H3M7X1_9GLOM|nr:hypothetical protein GLOIN_2v1764957 [Rhizophagus clarus]